MSPTLAGNIAHAIDDAQSAVHEQLDTELSSRTLCLHYRAVKAPGNSERDRRTTSMRNYARILSAAHVQCSHVEAAVARMLSDSLDETFLVWTGKFCRDNPSVTNSAIDERMTAFSVFIALRSLTSTDETIDALFVLEGEAHAKFDDAIAEYNVTVRTAKDKLDKVRGVYESACRRRVRASGLSAEVDILTDAVPSSLREAVRSAEERYQRRKRNPTRNRKTKAEAEPETAAAPQQDNGESK